MMLTMMHPDHYHKHSPTDTTSVKARHVVVCRTQRIIKQGMLSSDIDLDRHTLKNY